MKKSLNPMGFITSSIGKKIIVSFSGLFLALFVTIHLAGNMLLFVGPDAFNLYTYNMTQNKGILYTLEVILIAGFLTHIILTALASHQNRKARPVNYATRQTLGMSTIFSSNMGITGSYILIFLIVHLRTFKFGEAGMVEVWGVPGAMVIDMYQIVTMSFSNSVIYSLFYILAMILLGGHMSHGAQSAFKSLGFYDTRMRNFFRTVSVTLGIIVGAGFSTIPIYFGFIY